MSDHSLHTGIACPYSAEEFLRTPYVTDTFALDAALLQLAAARRGLLTAKIGRATIAITGSRRCIGFHRNRSHDTPLIAILTEVRKDRTKFALSRCGLPVARGEVFTSYDRALAYFRTLDHPVVVKPCSGAYGNGVHVNVTTEERFKVAWEDAHSGRWKVVIEELIAGSDLRVFVIGDRVVAAAVRVPANVVGDGSSSVADLVEQKNSKRQLNPRLSSSPLLLNAQAKYQLTTQGLSAESIPQNGMTVYLNRAANVCAGGDNIDVTDDIHDDLKHLAVEAVKAFPGLQYAGVDLLAEDYTKSLLTHACAICEVNIGPVISGHVFPYEGSCRDIPSLLMSHYFPSDRHPASDSHSWVTQLRHVANAQAMFPIRRVMLSGAVRAGFFSANAQWMR